MVTHYHLKWIIVMPQNPHVLVIANFAVFFTAFAVLPVRLDAQAVENPLEHPIGELPSCVVEFEEMRKNLEDCTPYKCAFPDIFFSGFPVREILGQKDGGCSYKQEIPWGSFADCRLDEQTSADVLNEAAFLAKLVRRSAEEKLTTRTEMEMSKDGGSVKLFLGDEEIFYPARGISSAIESGHCEVRPLPY